MKRRFSTKEFICKIKKIKIFIFRLFSHRYSEMSCLQKKKKIGDPPLFLKGPHEKQRDAKMFIDGYWVLEDSYRRFDAQTFFRWFVSWIGFVRPKISNKLIHFDSEGSVYESINFNFRKCELCHDQIFLNESWHFSNDWIVALKRYFVCENLFCLVYQS